MVTADAILARLAEATDAAVTVRSGSAGTGGHGAGAVQVVTEAGVVVVSETGEWTYGDGRPMRWRATSRWWADGAALAVEHVRQGTPARAILDCQPDGQWLGRAPHACGDDLYSVHLGTEAGEVAVTWTISGPCKAARIMTRYS